MLEKEAWSFHNFKWIPYYLPVEIILNYINNKTKNKAI